MSYQECFLHIFGEKTIIFSQKSGLGFFQKTFANNFLLIVEHKKLYFNIV